MPTSTSSEKGKMRQGLSVFTSKITLPNRFIFFNRLWPISTLPMLELGSSFKTNTLLHWLEAGEGEARVSRQNRKRSRAKKFARECSGTRWWQTNLIGLKAFDQNKVRSVLGNGKRKTLDSPPR